MALKHAFLVIQHDNFENLIYLLKFLDRADSQNEVFLYIDKKSFPPPIDFSIIIKHIKIHLFPNPMKITWGGHSQVFAELELLKFAMQKRESDFYHLLSGACLPIKTWAHMEYFFEQYTDKNFIEIRYPHDLMRFIKKRVGTYHFFKDKIGLLERMDLIRRFCKKRLLRANDYIANTIGYFYTRKTYRETNFFYGSNWFSINKEFATYCLRQEAWIKKAFMYVSCGDEELMQTLIMNSPFKDTLFKINLSPPPTTETKTSNLRHIDWERGDGRSPYTFRLSDLDELLTLPNHLLFARKFNYKLDPLIYKELERRLRE